MNKATSVTLSERLTANPVILKELRGRMRGWRAFIVLTLYLLVMSSFVTLLYVAFAASTNTAYNGGSGQQIGKFVFAGTVGIELLLACFIAPAFTSGAISGERERQTFDLLRTTLLPAWSLVLGKLGSALLYTFLLFLAALPLQSLAFLLGGVEPMELAIASVLLVATAYLFGSAGVFFSSLMRRTLGATVLTYAFAIMATLGLPIAMLVMLPLTALFSYNSPGVLFQTVMIYGFGFLIMINPAATAIATEVILMEEQTYFFFTQSVYNPQTGNSIILPLVSPWLPYVGFALVFGTGLVLLSILAVRRTER